jgi:hypothetical protein
MKREHPNLHPQQLIDLSSLIVGGCSYISTSIVATNNKKGKIIFSISGGDLFIFFILLL